MKKKLYYTVEHYIDEYLTGDKSVIVYDIQDNEPKTILSFDCSVDDTTTDEISKRLNSELYPDVELIKL